MATREKMPVDSGEHRRHIIPQNLLVDAIDRFFEHQGKDISDESMADFMSAFGINKGQSRAKMIADLKNTVNNNLNNLFPGDGGENTSIGFLAKQVWNILEEMRERQEDGEAATAVFAWAKTAALNITVHFRFTKDHTDYVKSIVDPQVNRAMDLGALEENLQSIYHSLQFDPLKTSNPVFTDEMLGIYNELMRIKATGQGNLLDTLIRFHFIER